MDDATQLGFQFAKEVATQLIALSTGLLTLTITFTREIVKTAPARGGMLLPAAWGLHVLSVGFGVLSMMALTGTLMPIDMETRQFAFGSNVRLVAGVQIVAFFMGTACLAAYGLLALRAQRALGRVPTRRAAVVALKDASGFFEAHVLDGWEVETVVPLGDGRIAVSLHRDVADTAAR